VQSNKKLSGFPKKRRGIYLTAIWAAFR